ncbi:MAG: hypothetical protein ACK5L6_03885 [Anaerorhabdus sp.]|uniref:hypothetical protein n=1 Tax=Anaerorhabdus sp. TaxID=1872524 RepID=UPI003A88A42B
MSEGVKDRYKRINYFKSELNNYRYYQQRLEELKLELEVIEYDLQGVKGISYGGTSIENKESQAEKDMKKMLLIQQKGEVERKIDSTKQAIVKIDYVLSMICNEFKELIMRLYILENTSYKEQLEKFKYTSLSTLKRDVDREIYRCIKSLY